MSDSMQVIEKNLLELMSDFNTIASEPKTYKLLLDDIINTTSARYVTDATSGYFPDKIQPAYKCLQTMVALTQAARAESAAEKLEKIVEAIEYFDKAEWDGYDQNQEKLTTDFMTLRTDQFASTEESYNQKLASIYDAGGALFMAIRGKGFLAQENVFAAIPKLATAVSIARIGPYNFTTEEQAEAFKAAKRMMAFAKYKLGGGR